VANGTNSTGAHAAKASKDLSIADALRPIRIDPSGEGVWCEWVGMFGRPDDRRPLLKHLGKESECYVRTLAKGHLELGPLLRWLCVLRWICARIEVVAEGEAAEPARVRSRGRIRWSPVAKAEMGLSNLQELADALAEVTRAATAGGQGPAADVPIPVSAFKYRTKDALSRAAEYSTTSDWSEALVRCVSAIRKLDGLPEVTLAEIVSVPVVYPKEPVGSAAVWRFERWIATGNMPVRDSLSQLCCEVYSTTSATSLPSQRERQLRDVVDEFLDQDGAWRVSTTSGATESQPIVNVWSASNLTGLRAFATEFCLRAKERMTGNTARSWGVRTSPGIVFVPLSRIMVAEGNVSRRWVLECLSNALSPTPATAAGDRSAPDAAHRPEQSEEGWELQTIDRIRRCLTCTPTLVVFGGLESSSEPFGPLMDVLRNFDWPVLIRQLAQPHLGSTMTGDGGYASRILVLSNQPVLQLRPWMASAPLELRALEVSFAVRDLLLATQHVSTAYGEVGARCERLWPDATNRPRCDLHKLGLQDVYALDQAAIDSLQATTRGMPAELDLTLTSWAQRSGAAFPEAVPSGAAHSLESVAAWRLRLFRNCLHGAKPDGEKLLDAGSILVLQLIALSINGLRISTLHRCLREYSGATKDESLKADIDKIRRALLSKESVEEFRARFSLLLTLTPDEEPEAALAGRRWFELQADSHDHVHRNRSTSGLIFDLRFEELRELFYADLLADAPYAPDTSPEWRDRFFIANRLLAEEAIAQATSQLRRLPVNAVTRLYAVRRLLETAFHGLLSLRQVGAAAVDKCSLDEVPVESLGRSSVRATSLPRSDGKLLVYLYEFVYRHCIEDVPLWTLGRGFARNDIRIPLLAMFLDPEWARVQLHGLHALPVDKRSFDALGLTVCVDRFCSRHVYDRQDSSLPLHLAKDIYLAVLHATKRSPSMLKWIAERYEGQRPDAPTPTVASSESTAKTEAPDVAAALATLLEHGLRRRTREAPEELDRKEPSAPLRAADTLADVLAQAFEQHAPMTAGVAHSTDDSHWRHQLMKVSIDALQSDARLDEALALCTSVLRGQLHDLASSVLRQGETFRSIGWNKAVLEDRAHLGDVATRIVGKLPSQRALNEVSDVLFRLGEILAAKADEVDYGTATLHPTRPSTEEGLVAFGNAYGAFWIADRLRASAAFQPDASIAWSIVSARSMRYFVRTSLKLAKFLDRLRSRDDVHLQSQSNEFYVLARGRVDAYSRHLFRIPAERLNMLLLMVSTARVRSTLDFQTDKVIDMRGEYADVSLEYLSDAEALWVRLGCPLSIGKRLFLERVKTLSCVLNLDRQAPQAAVYERRIRNDKTVLRQMSQGSAFWMRIVDHLDSRSLSGH
jgi:hypothetical protein